MEKIKVEPVRDIISAMLLIRSQVLNDGDKIGSSPSLGMPHFWWRLP
jgi:hypothetical protein